MSVLYYADGDGRINQVKKKEPVDVERESQNDTIDCSRDVTPLIAKREKCKLPQEEEEEQRQQHTKPDQEADGVNVEGIYYKE